ncbi:MAG: extracellular solute-binding protein family 1 [Sphingobacterium sp.]|jgi:multiple sugar transport system substrate-binding protein|nr:extracellular solute-binding protein family 1 [Sphingobacterium sp.]
MKKFTKKLSCMLAGLLVVAGLAGCGNASGNGNESAKYNPKEKVTLTFWHTYSDTEKNVFNKEVIPLFEKKYPNIKIKSVTMPTNNLQQQVISAAAGKSGPDVMRMDKGWVPEIAKLGALQQIDTMKDFQKVKKSQLSAAMVSNLYKGHYYGIPNDVNTKIAIYDKVLLKKAGLKEAPKTIDELVAASKKIKDTKHFGIGLGGTAQWNFLPYFWSMGGKLSNDKFTKATGYLDSQASINAVQQIVNWHKQDLVNPAVLGGQPGFWDGIKSHQYLMIDDGPWFYSLQGAPAKKNTVAAQFPTGKSGSISILGGENTVIFNSTQHAAAAWIFAKFIASKEAQQIMAEKTGQLPSNLEAMKQVKASADQTTKQYIEQLGTAKPVIPSGNAGKIDDLLSKTFESIYRGKISVKAGLHNAATQLDTLLQQ